VSGGGPPSDPPPVADFAALPRRIRKAAAVVGGFALGGFVLDGIRSGLTVGLVVRWFTLAVAATLLVAAVVTALHALGGADAVQKRGERLSGDDVRLRPPARRSRQRDGAGPEGV
jgi:hypothetical protein